MGWRWLQTNRALLHHFLTWLYIHFSQLSNDVLCMVLFFRYKNTYRIYLQTYIAKNSFHSITQNIILRLMSVFGALITNFKKNVDFLKIFPTDFFYSFENGIYGKFPTRWRLFHLNAFFLTFLQVKDHCENIL